MTLGFSQIINKKPSYFVEKICKSHIEKFIPGVSQMAITAGYSFNWQVYSNCKPKIHTAREDKKNLWRKGLNIHPVINNRTARRCQFTPALPCTGTQTMVINWGYDDKTQMFSVPMVLIDGREIKGRELDQLAVNDGFENRVEFFQYFNTDWKGKLIHWTDFKY